MAYCAIAGLHAARDLEQGGDCQCVHCMNECACEGDWTDEELYDADELGLDPEDDDARKYGTDQR